MGIHKLVIMSVLLNKMLELSVMVSVFFKHPNHTHYGMWFKVWLILVWSIQH